MTIGKVISDARFLADMTQGELASRVDVSRTQIVNIEGGKSDPSVVTVEQIAKALRCTFATDGDGWWQLFDGRSA